MHGTAYHPAPGEIELASMPVSSQVVTSDWQAAQPVLGGNPDTADADTVIDEIGTGTCQNDRSKAPTADEQGLVND